MNSEFASLLSDASIQNPALNFHWLSGKPFFIRELKERRIKNCGTADWQQKMYQLLQWMVQATHEARVIIIDATSDLDGTDSSDRTELA